MAKARTSTDAKDVRFLASRKDTLLFQLAPSNEHGRRPWPIGYLVVSLPIARATFSSTYVSRTGRRALNPDDADRWIRRAMEAYAGHISRTFYVTACTKERDERWEAPAPGPQSRLEQTVSAAAFRDKHADDAAELELLNLLSAPLRKVLPNAPPLSIRNPDVESLFPNHELTFSAYLSQAIATGDRACIDAIYRWMRQRAKRIRKPEDWQTIVAVCQLTTQVVDPAFRAVRLLATKQRRRVTLKDARCIAAQWPEIAARVDRASYWDELMACVRQRSGGAAKFSRLLVAKEYGVKASALERPGKFKQPPNSV